LLLTLLAAALWPRIGASLHALALTGAICLDQLRIQPEFVSLAILLVGTLPRRAPLLIARCHLISLWLWAGIHKLLCPQYLDQTGPDLAHGMFADLSSSAAFVLGIVVAAAELVLGLTAIVPLARRLTPKFALLVHGGILLVLVARGWNSAVWPWNVALAAAGYGYFAGWNRLLLTWDDGVELPVESAASDNRAGTAAGPLAIWSWRVVAAIVLAYPGLFYLNLCDGYLAWCVYASNTPEATIHDDAAPSGQRLFDRAYERLNVPFSPAARLFEQYFRRVGRLDDRLQIDDSRPMSRWRGREKRILIWTAEGVMEVVTSREPR
jgi:hypothetical protein